MIKIINKTTFEVYLDGKKYECEIFRSPTNGYFLGFGYDDNNILFETYHINKDEFYRSILHKNPVLDDCDTNWPWCNSEEDVLKLLFALDAKISREYEFCKYIKKIPVLV